MAQSLGDLVVRIVGDNAQFDSSIDKSEDKLKTFQNTASQLGKSLSLFVTAPLIGLGVAAVKSSAEMEMLETSFTTMLGSAKEASVLMASLKKLAAETPFETTDLANVTKSLLQYGVANKDILPTLRMLGDVSGGNAQKFAGLSYQFAQMTSRGRLLGDDLRSMINNGFNPLQVMAEKLANGDLSKLPGIMLSLQDQMSKGQISTAQVTEAFRIATSEGGKFFNGMKAGSQTLQGLVSTLKDDLGALGRSFADEFIPRIKDIVKQLSIWAQQFSALDKDTKNTILTIVGVAAAIGPMISAVSLATKAFTALKIATAFLSANPWVIGIGLVVAGVASLAKTSNEAKKEQEKLNTELDKTIDKKDKIAPPPLTAQEKYNQALQLEALAIKQITELKDGMNKVTSDDPALTAQGRKAYADAIRDAEALLRLSKVTLPVLKAQAEAEKKVNEELNRGKPTADQQAVIDAEKAIASGFTQIAEQAELARISGEDFNEIEEKRSIVLDQINKLIEKNFDVQGPGIQKIILANKELLKTEEDLVFTVQQVNDERDEEISAEEYYNQKAIENLNKLEKEWIGYGQIVANQLKDIQNLINQFSQNQLDKLNQETDARLTALDEQMEAELEAAGLADKTAVESAQLALDEAKKSGDAIAIAEAESALKRAKIEEDYSNKKVEIEKEAAKKAYQINLAQFKANQAFSIAQAVIDTASAILKALVDPGGFAGIALSIAAGVTGAAQIAAIAGQAPPAPPALAEGGIVNPRPGGTDITVAEAGEAEIISPLSKLPEILKQLNGNQGLDEGNIYLTVNLDSKPFLETIFPATRNKTVLIDAGAIV